MFLRNVVSTRATRRNIPENGILHSHRRENIKSYIIIYYLCAESTATKPITHAAQWRSRQLHNGQIQYRIECKLLECINAEKKTNY
jgi:hypothetical protein